MNVTHKHQRAGRLARLTYAAGLVSLALAMALGLAGIAFKVARGAMRHPRLSTAVYLGMGWVFLLAAGPVWQLMPLAGLLWLLAGGAGASKMVRTTGYAAHPNRP